MKNLKLSITLAFVAVLGLAGKTNAQSSTRVGLKAGLTYMTLGAATSNGVSINYDYRPGFQGGITFEAPLSESISFNPQLLYTQKGGNAIATIMGINVDVKTQVNYIDLPLLFGFKANPSLSFYAGPQVSFLMSQKTVAIVTGYPPATSTETDDLQKTAVGGNIGAGYAITNNVGINLNYMFDFGHAGKGSNDTGERNSGFALTLGYKF
jgi:outer membrane immunogenic protein